MSDQTNSAKPGEPAKLEAAAGKPAQPTKPEPASDKLVAPPAKPPTAVEAAASAQSVTLFVNARPLPKSGPLGSNAAKPAGTAPFAAPAAEAPKPAPVAPSAAPPTTQTAVSTRPSASAAPASSEPAATFASSLNKPAPAPVPTNQQKCGTCGHMNRAGLLICENCGSSLVNATATIIGTRQFLKGSGTLTSQPEPKLNTVEVNALLSAGADVFDESMILRLEVDGAGTPILVYPKDETSLGRRDPAGGTMPDVDLTSYAAYRMGVSRRHAILMLKSRHLQIVDLGSSNGTMVNGVKLAPHQPRPLRDGDMLSLGKMGLRVIFQAGARR